jgi:hypothetical protein
MDCLDRISVLLHVGASQVHIRDMSRLMGVQCDLQRQVGGGATRTPRRVRVEAFRVGKHAIHPGVEILHTLLGAGWEVFQ